MLLASLLSHESRFYASCFRFLCCRCCWRSRGDGVLIASSMTTTMKMMMYCSGLTRSAVAVAVVVELDSGWVGMTVPIGFGLFVRLLVARMALYRLGMRALVRLGPHMLLRRPLPLLLRLLLSDHDSLH